VGGRRRPAGPGAPLTIDLDSTIVEVHGRAKQGAAFGYTKGPRLHPQLATCAQTGQVLMSRLRGGSAGAARGAASFLTETISRVRNAGATGQLTVRADSAFYSKKVLATAAKFDVRFSITARQDKRVRAAIDAIPTMRGSRSCDVSVELPGVADGDRVSMRTAASGRRASRARAWQGDRAIRAIRWYRSTSAAGIQPSVAAPVDVIHSVTDLPLKVND
jgi:hypothetical protein